MRKILMNKMREPFAYILCPLYNPLNQIVIFLRLPYANMHYIS